jgi:hypothetical protein
MIIPERPDAKDDRNIKSFSKPVMGVGKTFL